MIAFQNFVDPATEKLMNQKNPSKLKNSTQRRKKLGPRRGKKNRKKKKQEITSGLSQTESSGRRKPPRSTLSPRSGPRPGCRWHGLRDPRDSRSSLPARRPWALRSLPQKAWIFWGPSGLKRGFGEEGSGCWLFLVFCWNNACFWCCMVTS